MKRILYCLLILQILGMAGAWAQTKRISGIVTDSSGEAMIGASVIEKGTSNGTSTDAAGRFVLVLKGTLNRILVTSQGYTPQDILIRNPENISVRLMTARAESTEEVVVVGFGRKKAITNTGSVSSISGAAIRDNPSASVQNTLAGRLPGFFSQQTSGRPGNDGAAFYIRGVSSYNTGSNTPLIVIDDVESSYDLFARIDPNEIETVSILKDASTTAVYGVRGANGVVIVTTRRGKNGPPVISFRGETSLQQPTIMPKYLNAFESASIYNQAQINDGVLPASRQFKQSDLDAYRDHTDPYGHPDVDWRKELFKTFSKQIRGNFDITGGSDRVKYFISAGYLFQDGMVKDFGSKVDINNNFYNQRYNYRSNLDIKVTKTTDLALNISGNISQINQPQVGSPNGWNDVFADYGSFWTLAPFAYPVYNPNGSFGYSNWQKSPGLGGSTYDANNIIGRLTYLGYTRTFENNMNVMATLNQKLDFITKGLSLKGTVSYSSSYGDPGNATNTVSMSGGEFPSYIYDAVADTYTPRNTNTFRVRRLIRSSSNGATNRNVLAQGFLNYDRNFSNRHHVYGMVSYLQNSLTRYSSNAVYNFIPNNVLGWIGRVGYDYKQKYLVEFNAGRNGSDRFSENNRYGFFPAVSAGWNIAEEGFFKDNISFVNRLKLRGSYGLVGNDKLGNNFAYYYQQTYGTAGGVVFFGDPNANSGGGVFEGTLGNDKVGWEKEKKLDIAIEAGLFKNTLSVTVEYFNNNRFDILTSRSSSVSGTFGQSLPAVNIGKVNNKGIEVELSYAKSINKNTSYSVRGTYSYAKNKIMYQDEPSYKYAYQSFTGHSIGTQRVYTFLGFYKDTNDIKNSAKPLQTVRPGDLKYADLNGDGVIDGFDQSVQGDPNVPNTTGGIQLGFKYKNFSIGVFFQGSMNFNVRGSAEAIRAFGSNLTEIHKQSWTPELGDNAKFPVITFTPGISDPTANASTFWLIPGDFIRLKTAEIGYSLPKKWINSLHMKDIRFYANGYNIFTWTKLSKLYQLDPEVTSGTDRVNYPPQRTINFGVSASF